jgi:plasmid stabilization system protein ParE
MAKVIWSDDSLEDLRQIVSYIAADNPAAALRVGKRLLNFVRFFETSPRMGHVYVGGPDEIRVSNVDDYLIYYSYEEDRDCVTIEHVWHGAREQPEFRSA